MSVRIASAGEAPVAALAALHARAFAAGWSEAEIARLMALPNAIAIAAFSPETVGFLLAWTMADEAEILTLAVAPAQRRAGIGRRLLEAGLAVAAAAGARAMILEVGERNEAARRLYEAAGFREIGRRTGYYAGDGGGDALILKRMLGNAEARAAAPGQSAP